jgi:hypothetical protein
MADYGTLQGTRRHRQADLDLQSFEWEKNGAPLQLLLSVGLNVGRNLVALLLLFWQLFMHRSFIMNCDSRVIGNWAYLCEYTKAYVRCFPLLGAIVVMMVAFRQLLQQRIYYGLLKRGALLDFHNTKAWQDPLFWILVLSFLQGTFHFVLDMCITDDHYNAPFTPLNPEVLPGARAEPQWQADLRTWIMSSVVPAVVFFGFLVSSYDLESQLVPLSKYFEENPIMARQLTARMPFLDEGEVKKRIPSLSLKTSDEKTTLDAVYREIIEKTPELWADDHHGREPKGMQWHLLSTLWPSKILLDPKLTCAESRQFFRILVLVGAINNIIMIGFVVYFCFRVYTDCMDVYHGQHSDIMSLIVFALHAAVVGFVVLVKLRLTKDVIQG